MFTSGFPLPAKTLVALTPAAVLAVCLLSAAASISARSQLADLPHIYYDDFEKPWAVKVILENDFAGLDEEERQLLLTYMWGVDDFTMTPPKKADPACGRLADADLHQRMQSLGFRAAADFTQLNGRNPNVLGQLDALARAMQSIKAARQAGREDIYLLAADYGGCSGRVVARFLTNIKAVARMGFPGIR